jgi:hypothetical protein
MTTFPLQQKTEYPHATLLKTTKETPKDGAVTIYQLELHNRYGSSPARGPGPTWKRRSQFGLWGCAHWC